MAGNDYIAPIVARMTYNGAVSVRNAVTNPHPEIPRLWNGNASRVFTGLGKWTTIAAIGVENHVKSLGLVEEFDAQPIWRPGPWEHPWIVLVLNDLGMEVARYLDAHWRELTFLDKTRRAREDRWAERRGLR